MLDREEKDEEYPQLDLRNDELHQSAMENMYSMNEVRSVPGLDNVDKYVEDDEKSVILDPSVLKEDPFARKRKLESLSGILNWVTEIAKDPGNSAIEGSERKLSRGNEFWHHALLAREALFLRRQADSSVWQSLLQKKQKIHRLYEDHVGVDDQSTERIRCSERLLLKKSHLRSSSKSPSATQSDLDMSITPHTAGLDTADSGTNLEVDLLGDDHVQKRVPVGPLFQAEVPDWTGIMASESDSKWLGTRVWPLVTGERNLLIERDPMGKGRQDSCGCQYPGSVECVRFHIGEKRTRVKLELGSAFHHWRFDRMGEEVSLPWTDEEEKRFKYIVRLNPPSLEKSFWDEVFKCFHTKSRENLVSYYFNVFLLRRRSYQNRVTPNNIDSDDDESEFGYVSFGFGHQAVKVPGSTSVFCA